MEGEVALFPHPFKIRKLRVKLRGCFVIKMNYPFTWYKFVLQRLKKKFPWFILGLYFFPQLFYDVIIFPKLIPAKALQQQDINSIKSSILILGWYLLAFSFQ